MLNEEKVVAYDSVSELIEVPTKSNEKKVVLTKEELEASGCQKLSKYEKDLWLQFNTLSVGIGENKRTFDLVKIFEGLTRLAEVTIIPQEQSVEDFTDDIEEVKQEGK